MKYPPKYKFRYTMLEKEMTLKKFHKTVAQLRCPEVLSFVYNKAKLLI